MTQKVYYDVTTGAITGMYDDAVRPSPSVPNGQAALAVTPAQWVQIGPEWGVVNGTLTTLPVVVSTPSLAQQAQGALSAGLTITSTGTPALDGVYSVNSTAQQNITATQLYVTVNGKFPGSSGTMSWSQANGSVVTFPSVAEFQAFASAVASYVADLQEIILTNSGSLPEATATLP
ncbi:hypothetical protein FVF58_09635 [Paraburkholderia panacisoli]|uniref:DUF4376 domain-containing protein n=1 Tax=Paraburkholderia panacisoli TaxID=2603818 RepID=A0A5B0HD43_9BURK|nr:hypothetical protein [Paraburkholderia panacisoli]KAA1013042.1 hypothetical protein FVF58_09635 [Paraburkholderia panacisoli]